VERALDRLDDGQYGWCERCGNADPGRAAGRVPVGYALRDVQAVGGAALTQEVAVSDGGSHGRTDGRGAAVAVLAASACWWSASTCSPSSSR
jgi:hypothetical protein